MNALWPVFGLIFCLPLVCLADSGSRCGMPGAPCAQEVDDPEIKELAAKAVAKISADSDGPFQLVLVRVVEAKSQVVAGTLYSLRVVVGQSRCKKGEMGANCAQEGDRSARKIYDVHIWSKPWENFEQIRYEAITATE